MPSSDSMFDASSAYFKNVDEGAAHVKVDRVSVSVDLGRSKSPVSLVNGWFSTTGHFMNEN